MKLTICQGKQAPKLLSLLPKMKSAHRSNLGVHQSPLASPFNYDNCRTVLVMLKPYLWCHILYADMASDKSATGLYA